MHTRHPATDDATKKVRELNLNQWIEVVTSRDAQVGVLGRCAVGPGPVPVPKMSEVRRFNSHVTHRQKGSCDESGSVWYSLKRMMVCMLLRLRTQ